MATKGRNVQQNSKTWFGPNLTGSSSNWGPEERLVWVHSFNGHGCANLIGSLRNLAYDSN